MYPATETRASNFASVQCLRALAAIMVVAFHVPGPLGLHELSIPILNGGVDLFFVISGFVMVISTRSRDIAPLTFIRQRLIRIVPLYWLMTAVVLLGFWGQGSGVQEILKSIFFIPYLNTANDLVQPILGVGWTLNLELIFYLLFAVSMFLGAKSQILALGSFFLCMVLIRIITKPAVDTVLFFYTTPMLFEFLAGMLAAHFVSNVRKIPLWTGAASILSAIFLSLFLGLNYDLPRTIDQGLPSLLLLIGCIRLEDIFRTKPFFAMRKIGDASYSIYLVHTIVFAMLLPYPASSSHPAWAAGIVMVAASILAGIMIYSWIERPLLQAMRGKSSGTLRKPAMSS